MTGEEITVMGTIILRKQQAGSQVTEAESLQKLGAAQKTSMQ